MGRCSNIMSGRSAEVMAVHYKASLFLGGPIAWLHGACLFLFGYLLQTSTAHDAIQTQGPSGAAESRKSLSQYRPK